MSYPAKEMGRNIVSVIAGVLIALLIILPIGLLVALMSFSDSKIPKSQELFSSILLIGVIIGCIVGGYAIAKISTRKKMAHGSITSVILTFLFALVNDFKFD